LIKLRAEEVAIGRCRRPDESLEASDGFRVYGDALAHMAEAVLFLSCRGFSLLFRFNSLPSLPRLRPQIPIRPPPPWRSASAASSSVSSPISPITSIYMRVTMGGSNPAPPLRSRCDRADAAPEPAAAAPAAERRRGTGGGGGVQSPGNGLPLRLHPLARAPRKRPPPPKWLPPRWTPDSVTTSLPSPISLQRLYLPPSHRFQRPVLYVL
jgi:hypothetical protein